MNNKGYVYVLTNQSMKGLVKIGKTERKSEERARELSSTTGVPTPFNVVYDSFFEDCNEAEKYIHILLENKGYRVASNREFFEIPVKEAIGAVIKAKEHFDIKVSESFTTEELKDDKNNYDPDIDNPAIVEIMQKASEYHYGHGEELQDINEAIKCYKQAVKLGSLEAYSELGHLYSNGEEIKEDRDKALSYFKEGAKKGNSNCYSSLASIYLNMENEKNAYKCWQKYFTIEDNINYMDGVNYLRFIARYPENKIEYISKLKPLVDEIFEKFSIFDFVFINGKMHQIHPEFIKYAEDVINNKVIQEDVDVARTDEEIEELEAQRLVKNKNKKSGFFKRLFGF